jgi:type VI protein secretion system component Hcp
MRLPSPLMSCALTLAMLAAPIAAMAGDYLQLPGIAGGSVDPQHKGWIDVSSFDVSTLAVSTAGSNTGAGAGRPPFSQITLVASVSPATVALTRATETGQHFATGELDAGGAGGARAMIYKLTDVMVTGVQLSSGGAATVTLKVAKLDIEYPGNLVGRVVPAATTVPNAARAP